jgi:hypothetical protein
MLGKLGNLKCTTRERARRAKKKDSLALARSEAAVTVSFW